MFKIRERIPIEKETLSYALLRAFKEETMEDFIKEMNRILLEKLNVDYISFFSDCKKGVLFLSESTLQSNELRKELEKILKFRDPAGQDFSDAIGEDGQVLMHLVAIVNDDYLLYPSAFHRKIRSAIFIPVEDVGFFLIEDNRKIVTSTYIEMIENVFKAVTPCIQVFNRQFKDDVFKLPTKKYLSRKYKGIYRSVIKIYIDNINELYQAFSPGIRYDLYSILIDEVKEYQVLREIGIDQFDGLYIYSLSPKEEFQPLIDALKEKLERMKLTIDEQTVNMKVSYEIEGR